LATSCLTSLMPIVKPILTNWSSPRFIPFIYTGNRARGGCDRSTVDAYSSMAPDPTPDIFRGLCTSILWFVFPIGLMRLITVCYFCHFIGQYLYLSGWFKIIPISGNHKEVHMQI
jgi:hypothetical protein